MSAPAGADDHTVPLGATGWRVWRWALLRSAGFPADGLVRFTAPGAASSADAYLATGADAERAAFGAAYDAALRRTGAAVHDLAGDPLFREAVTWQNPAAVDTMLDPLRAGGPVATRNSSRRQKETGVARYWSRYCAKNDTIGFFGPICWARIGGADAGGADDPQAPAGVSARPGTGLVRSRRVELERWALAAYAERLHADPEIRQWLPAKLATTVSLHGRVIHHPFRGEITLQPAAVAVVARCDGRRAVDIAGALVGDPGSGLRRLGDVYLHLRALADKELVTWGVDLPVSMEADAVMRRDLAAIDDPATRARALSGLRDLYAGRDAVAAAAGDDGTLRGALATLAATFTRVTGAAPTQAAGRMYAGRTVCYEDTVRDLDVTVTGAALDGLAAPLALLCTASRWLSVRVAQVYRERLRALYEELVPACHDRAVPFAELSFLAQGLLFGSGPKPVDVVADEFTRRWGELLGLDTAVREIRLRSADLLTDVATAFDVARPAWAFARYHSPDVHLLRDEDGHTSFVLGEMHATWNALYSEFFIQGHDDPGALLAYQARDVPPGRILPLLPATWPRLTPRTCAGLRHPDDWQLGFVPAPGADPARLLPITTLVVTDEPVPGDGGEPGDLTVRAPNGRCWPLTEVFADLLAILAVDAFKLLGGFAHSPRVWVDRMVLTRETWRRTAGELDFVGLRDERERYLRVRHWRAELGLPERVFVKIATEVKPIYVDLTSPVYVTVLCLAVRAAAREGGPDTAVTITEMLPLPEQAWVPDRQGNRYVSELRLLAVDPRRAAWTGAG